MWGCVGKKNAWNHILHFILSETVLFKTKQKKNKRQKIAARKKYQPTWTLNYINVLHEVLTLFTDFCAKSKTILTLF